MKKIIVGLLLIFIVLSANAQWYTKKFNVSNLNELTKEQLDLALSHANSNIRTGKTLTFTGLGIFAIGGILFSSGLNDMSHDSWNDFNNDMSKSAIGLIAMTAGVVVDAIGIPFWITGKTRKNDIEIALVTYKPTASLGVGPPSSLAVGIRINF